MMFFNLNTLRTSISKATLRHSLLVGLLLIISAPVFSKTLIIAPHPDDDIITAAGVIRTALDAGEPVQVVYMTNGDFAGVATGLLRQGEAVTAELIVGVTEPNLIFLGYPNGDLENLFNNYRLISDKLLAISGASATYGTRGLGSTDYHSFLTGSPADYNLPNIQSDLLDIITKFKPDTVYTTSVFDLHSDHYITYQIVKDALVAATELDNLYAPVLNTTIVHTSDTDLWPEATNPATFHVQPPGLGFTGLGWANRLSLEVPVVMQDTNLAANSKYQAILAHASQLEFGDFIARFVHRDEIFWSETILYSPGPAPGSVNIASLAAVSASSQNAGQSAAKAVDGILGGWPGDSSREWATEEEVAGAWIQLTWSSPYTVSSVSLYDRPNSFDQITSGQLVFSDGSTVAVGVLDNSGLATSFSFTPRVVTGVRLDIISSSVSTANVGLSEIEVYSVSQTGGNIAPIAIAGVDQAVSEGAIVQLNGASSNDPDGSGLTFIWSQTRGTAVSLSSTTVESPAFTAPSGLTASEILTFSLIVNDGVDSSLADTVNITVNPIVNTAPTANAGTDAIVAEGVFVQLDGSLSSDVESPTITYIWSQTSGTAVVLSSTTLASPSFTTPTGLPASELLTFSLIVNDGTTNSLPDSVVITVTSSINSLPVANAGIDQSVAEGANVQLDGSLSSDIETPILTHLWTQTGGATVSLSLATAVSPTFIAPTGLTAIETLIFSLVVNDGTDNSIADTVVISVDPAPLTSNIAALAAVSASSQNIGEGQSALKAVDGLLGGWPGDSTREWATEQELAGAWINLAWSSPYLISSVVLYDRPNTFDQVTSAQLVFSDGSTVAVGALDNSGLATTINFAQRVVTSVRLDIISASAATANVGLSEMEVYGVLQPVANIPPIANAGPNQSLTEGALVQLNGSTSSDPDGAVGGLTFLWSQTTGSPVTLSSTTVASPTFTAPSGLSTAVSLTFALTVNDGTDNSVVDTVIITVNPVFNALPIANAGTDSIVAEGVSVQLNGGLSSDAESPTVTYLWSQTSGTAVTLSSTTTATPTFTSPTGLLATDQLVFSLVVNDGSQNSLPDAVTVTVTAAVNTLPVANAGVDQSVTEGTVVSLNGSLSNDIETPILTYVWTQTSGAAVVLNSAAAESPTFTAPSGLTATVLLTFSLVVNDGTDNSLADTVVISVNPFINTIPIANAGADQTVANGSVVQLNGSLSSDVETPTLTYLWAQTVGTTVTLSSTTAASPSFTAPSGSTLLETFSFSLIVNDGSDNSLADTVIISVNPVATSANIAGSATVTASSENIDTGQTALKAVDGVPDGWPGDFTREWATSAETAGAWINLSYTGTYLVDRVVLFDRPNNSDRATSGELLFSDGSTVSVGALNNAGTATTITFAPRIVNSVRFTVLTTSGSTANVGLAEMEVYGVLQAGGNIVPVANAGTDKTVNEGILVQLDGSQSSDVESPSLTYLWSQTGGSAVLLSSTTVSSPTFTAPTGLAATEALVFSLVVNDGTDSSLADLVTISVLPASITSAGLDHYWLLDETSGASLFLDSVANLSGTCANCPTGVAGIINGAQLFDGINDSISIPQDLSFNWGVNQNFSIELWMKTSASCGTNGKAAIARIDLGTSLSWWLGCKNSQAKFSLVDATGGTTSAEVIGTTNVTDGQWHHIMAVRDAEAGRVKLYVDGVVEASVTESFASGFESATAGLTLGSANVTGGGLEFNGSIDEVALQGRVLSDSTIEQHYNDGAIGLQLGYVGCNGSPIKIMPMGDSITEGTGSTSEGGYRSSLSGSLANAGYFVDFVGRNRILGATYDSDSEGHSGFSTSDILLEINDIFTANQPDMILLHIGTNDIQASLTSSVAGVAALLDSIYSFDPTIRIVLSKIINRVTFDQTTSDFNVNLAALAQSKIAAGYQIILIDQESTLNYVSDMSDNLHPNDSGYDKMAQVWHTELTKLLPTCNPIAPAFKLQSAIIGYNGTGLSFNMAADGNPTPDFSLVSGPTGMTVHSNLGIVNWVPPTTGAYTMTAQATNGVGSDSSSLPIYIYPNSSYVNIAPTAALSASSEDPAQVAINAIDGVVSGYPLDSSKEWSSLGEQEGAWIQLNWGSSFTVDRVVLYDRPNSSDEILSGVLSFSDGSTVNVGALNNDGSATVISFTSKSISSVRFTVITASGATLNVGLAEFEVIGSPF